MMRRAGLTAFLFAVAAACAGRTNAQSSVSPVDDLSRLPLTEMRATPDTGRIVAIFLTGDGGWSSLDKQVVGVLRAHGVSVIGLNTRPYLSRKKEPAEIADDLSRIARRYISSWNRPRLAIVGYSRGADLMPFGVALMPADLRSRMVVLAMLGLSTRTGFEFHFEDLFMEVQRKTDRPTLPVVEQLKGMRMLCIYGAEETNSACRDAAPNLFTKVVQLPGGHHYDDNFVRVGNLVMDQIRAGVTPASALPAEH